MATPAPTLIGRVYVLPARPKSEVPSQSMDRPTDDERIAREAVGEWLGADVTLSSLLAMNSSTWQVAAGGERYVLKIAAPTDAPGLEVAAWLDAHGLRTGTPLRTSVRGSPSSSGIRCATRMRRHSR